MDEQSGFERAEAASALTLRRLEAAVDELTRGITRNATSRPLNVICVGRLNEQKGQLLLIEAARHLIQDGVDFTLTLAGDGELRGEIGVGNRIQRVLGGHLGDEKIQKILLVQRLGREGGEGVGLSRGAVGPGGRRGGGGGCA